jgi:hypothetical protein
MPEDEVDTLIHRIRKNEEMLKEAEEKGDHTAVEFLSSRLTLLKIEAKYQLAGGDSLEAPDNLSQLEFSLSKKRTMLRELENAIKYMQRDDIETPKYREMHRILSAQCEYLSAKEKIISENRSLSELSAYIQLTEENGVHIVTSALEHEAEVGRFKPKKTEPRKKEFVVDFQKITIVLVIFFLVLAVYLGGFWRKTPYDRDIIRSYVIARNHYIAGNDYYISGDYINSIKEYATAAAFFDQASDTAKLAAASKSGKMYVYFSNKERFFTVWEEISLKMIDSSEESLYGNSDLGIEYVEDAVEMADLADRYNRLADEAWRLL